MAFLLRFDGVNDKVEITNGLTLSSIGDYIEIDVDFEPTDNTQFLLGNKSGAFDQFLIYDTTRWRMRVFSGIAEIFVSLPSGRTTVRLELTSSGYELFYNGVSQGTFSQPAGFSPTLIGAWAGGSGYADIDLYGLIRATSTTTLNNYDPDASNGTGSILDDTVGGNDGTLINFPTDDSQWVFFDDGGGSLDISPASIPSEELFGAASVANTTSFLEPVAIGSLETVESPSVSAGLAVISPDSVESEEFVPEPVLDLLLKEILIGSIPDTFDVGRPVVVGGDRIVIPVLARTNFTKIKEYLETLGFSGALEDTILAWLRSEGYEGQWNDAWYAYLEDLGHTGAFPERLYKWRKL